MQQNNPNSRVDDPLLIAAIVGIWFSGISIFL